MAITKHFYLIQYKTALRGRDEGMMLSEMSGYSVHLQEVVQDLGRK